MIVELNGFDESGIIGENLRFVRVGIDARNELRPFIYNLLHFGSLIMTKKMLRGQYSEVQKDYVRAILSDPAIVLNHYVFPSRFQLELLRHFTCCELNRVADKRRELICAINSPDLKRTVSNVVGYFRKYMDPWGYVERFVKSYGFKMIVENLHNFSRVSRGWVVEEAYKIICLVDGGYPLVFWKRAFRENKVRREVFGQEDTSIFGITNGDEYYPVINLAGNVATITNRFHEMILPQSVKEIPYPDDFPLEEYCKSYEEQCSTPRFHSRILFIGKIEANLQYLIPFIHYKANKHKVCEPLRVSYDEKGSFRSFYKWFRGRASNDLIVFGKIETEEEKQMFRESETYNLKMVDAGKFLNPFQRILNEIRVQTRGTNLDRLSLKKIDSRLSKIESIVKKSLKV